MNRARSPRFLLCLLLLAALPAVSLAQTTGTVQGKVYYKGGDNDGQAAMFISVVLESERAGHAPRTVLTNEDGFYKFSGIESGTYLLAPTEAGYAPEAQIRVTLFPGDLKSEDLFLTPSEGLVVEIDVRDQGEGRLPGMKDTGVKRQIDSEVIRRVPLINNRVQDLLKLMPGVATTGGSESDQVSVTGGTPDQIAYRLDGANFTDILSGGPAGGVSSMAIDRFELISGGFQPEYGQASTGIANIITKTGSNEVEFQYALTWRDVDVIGSELDELDGVQRTWHRLLNAEEFPGTRNLLIDGLGGLWSSRDDDNNPTPRQRIQHQVGVGGPIVIDKVFFYTNLDVLSNDFGSPFDSNEYTEDVITYLAKVTWEVSDANKFWVEFNLEQTDADGLTNPQAERIIGTEDSDGAWTLAAHDRHAFESEGFLQNSFMELNFNWNHRYITQRTSGPDADSQVNVLMPPAGIIALITEGPTGEVDYTINDWRISSALTKPFDKHNVKIGGEYGYQTLEGTQERFPIYNDLRLMFTGGFGNDAEIPGSLGQYTDPGHPQSLDESAQLAALYVQDLWTVTDNLTLEPGLRIDWQDFVGKVLIAPRIGFSLDPAGNGRTQIQGSYGHFYQNLFLDALIHDLRPDQTVNEIISGTEASAQTVGFDVIGLDDLVDATIRFEDGIDTLGRVIPITTQVFDIDDRLTAPRNEQWTIRVRRLLPQNLVLDLAYTEAERKNARTTRSDTIDVGVGINEPSTVNILFATGGREEVQQWTAGLQKNFSNRWLLNASYTQQKVLGPVNQVADPLDPLRVQSSFGVLGRDRTEIIQLSASVDLPWKLNLSTNYRYQTGVPITPRAYSAGIANISDDPSNPILVTRASSVQPLGVNTMRLPPERSLDVTLARVFKFKSDNSLETRLTVFNLTNEFNVISGLATFGDLRDANPLANPPLEPGILPLTVDVPRTVQLEFRLNF